MHHIATKWFKLTSKKIVTSITFLPPIIAMLVLLLSFAMISFSFSAAGKSIKTGMHWLSLKDSSTARSICSAIAGGIFSLIVFRFSMLMILLNQVASQMSSRLLGKFISNRFQQVVLNFYIGTNVYALFLLSNIRDIDWGIYVPTISTAVISLHALGDLLSLKLVRFAEMYLPDKQNIVRVIVKEKTFEEKFNISILPFWDYGKSDRLVQKEMLNILMQLK